MTDTPTVYIVDDDNPSRESVEMLLAEMKVAFKSYASAEAFLEHYDGERPGCLVTDIRMLEMSGLELQEELQRRGTTLSVVVVTGYADTPVIVRAIKNGAVTLLQKPCRPHELWDAIREGLTKDAENYETIAGFMMYRLRKVPKRTDKVEFAGFRFEVVDIDNYRIDQLLVTRIADATVTQWN